jgi:NAD(P)H-hydrate epimerase
MELSDSKGMKAADRSAIQERGISSLTLMERAAGFVAAAAAQYMQDRPLAVLFCGPGNNGGDGIAAARLLGQMNDGWTVRAFLVGSREKMTPDARAMEQRLLDCGRVLEDFSPNDPEVASLVEQAGVIVDAVFGVGLSRPLTGDGLAAVQLMNGAGRPIVSADIPSGISADTGLVMGDGVRADVTVTFSRAKPGHYIEPGCVYRGALQVADIGIPADLVEASGCGVYAIRGEDISLPRRKRLSHKGDYGRLLILAGSVPYTGAPSLCARAAVRSGAGLVYLGVPQDIYEITAVKNQEAMPFPLPSNSAGRIAASAWDDIEPRLRECDVCVIGPGLGRDEDTRTITRLVLEKAAGPVVLDADSLWAVSQDLSLLKKAGVPLVLTPHEGEFARLLGRPVADRLNDARDFARDWGCALVLKGHRTICAFPDGKAYVIDGGNPGMAKGGSGDVLAGVLGAMLGQLACRRAVVTACWLHAQAGDAATMQYGEYGACASDIVEALPIAQRQIMAGDSR